jgi:hypothetical protein
MRLSEALIFVAEHGPTSTAEKIVELCAAVEAAAKAFEQERDFRGAELMRRALPQSLPGKDKKPEGWTHCPCCGVDVVGQRQRGLITSFFKDFVTEKISES